MNRKQRQLNKRNERHEKKRKQRIKKDSLKNELIKELRRLYREWFEFWDRLYLEPDISEEEAKSYWSYGPMIVPGKQAQELIKISESKFFRESDYAVYLTSPYKNVRKAAEMKNKKQQLESKLTQLRCGYRFY